MENERRPMLVVIAGPNGSGKSTFTGFFEMVGTYTNADEIVRAIGMDNLDAAVLADKMRYESIAPKEDFSFETVLSSEYKMDILRKAKESGYFIKCIFVLTSDPNVNIERVKARVAIGGHDVDENKVIERYYKSLDNVKYLMQICDILHVYDNTKEPFRIVRKHKQQLAFFPNEDWTYERIEELVYGKQQI